MGEAEGEPEDGKLADGSQLAGWLAGWDGVGGKEGPGHGARVRRGRGGAVRSTMREGEGQRVSGGQTEGR